MIVLRITIDGASRQIRSGKRALLLGSDPVADVTLTDAGWAGKAARLHHRSTEVFVEALDGTPSRSLRLGEEILLGKARVKLEGLLPLAGSEPQAAIFGDYDVGEEVAGGAHRSFTIAEDEGPRHYGTKTTSHTFRPSEPSRRSNRAPANQSPSEAPPAHADSAADARPARQRQRVSTVLGAPPATPASEAGRPKVEARAASEPKPALDSDRTADAAQLDRMLGRSSDFGSELYATLRKSPFYLVSCAVHFLAFALLALLPTNAGSAHRASPPGLLVGDFLAETDPVVEFSEDPLDPIPETEAELDLLEPPEEAAVDDPHPDNKSAPRSEDPDLADLPEPELNPVDVGIAPRNTSFRNRTSKRRPRVTKKDLEQKVLKGGGGEMNERSADIVRGEMGLGRGGGAKGLFPKRSEMLVVDGSFDHMERVLDALKLGYTRADPNDLVSGRKYRLDDYKVIFWNCGESPPEVRMAKFRPKLKRWIARGGYLFSTDWGIEFLLQPMFPKLVGTSGRRAPLREMVLHIQPSREARSDALLKGVFSHGAKGQWWLEQASFDIQVIDKQAIKVLIEAPQLKDIFQRSSALAITFKHGKGRVLHVMGHYFQKEGNLAGTLAGHRLALNFVIQRMQHARRR